MKSYKIAICAIGYNRVDCMARLLHSVGNAEYPQDVTLIVSVDKSNSTDVKDYAEEFNWTHGDKIVVAHPENLGLKMHILKCGGYLEEYNLDAIVVLEDDITVSPYYLYYVLSCMEKYENDDRVAGISLYNFQIDYVSRMPFNPMQSEFDIYMMNCAMSWGQVWMRKKWSDFYQWYLKNSDDFNLSYLPEKLNQWRKSWLKYHTRYCIEKNLYFIFPYISLSTNNGETGTHSKRDKTYVQSNLLCLPKKDWLLPKVDDCVVKYDGFFAPKFLSEYLNIPEEQLVVDFTGVKKGKISRKYLLTCEELPYKIVKSFALKQKPIETNIIMAISGVGIYLYDTEITSSVPRKIETDLKLEYYFKNIFEFLTTNDGIKLILKLRAKKLIDRIEK